MHRSRAPLFPTLRVLAAFAAIGACGGDSGAAVYQPKGTSRDGGVPEQVPEVIYDEFLDAGTANDAGTDGGRVMGDGGGSIAFGPVQLHMLQAQGMVGDPTREVVYVSVGPNDPLYPNNLVAISGDGVLWNTYVGSDPASLAIASDGSIIYVELDGSNTIMPVTQDGTIGTAFAVGYDESHGPLAVVEMKVFPDHPESLLVVFYVENISYVGGITIFDSGVARSSGSDSNWQTNQDYGFIDPTTATIASDSKVYAFNGASTGFELMEINLTGEGLSIARANGDIITGFDVAIEQRGGTLFASSGHVVDAATFALLGTFPVSHAPMFVDADGSHAYFVGTSDQGVVKCVTAMFSCRALSQINAMGIDEEAQHIVPFGASGLALGFENHVAIWTNGRDPS